MLNDMVLFRFTITNHRIYTGTWLADSGAGNNQTEEHVNGSAV